MDFTNKRLELGLKDSDFVCISAGDLIDRKNYGVAIEAIAKTKNPHIHYIICGTGPRLDQLKNKAAELGIESQVHFLGFRTDIKELMKISDIFLFTSLQEGLPRSLMEAMAVGLPVIVSKIRGNVDLVENGKGGYLCSPNDPEQIADAIIKLVNDSKLRNDMSKTNKDTIKEYDVSVVENEIANIYQEVLSHA